jgi:hypothetical protein
MEWKTLPSNLSYEISTSGNVRQKTRMIFNNGRYYQKKGGMVKIHTDAEGYLYVVLAEKGFSVRKFVHRLVAETFIGPCPEDKTVDHINRKRNDNRIENLRYATASEQNKNRRFKNDPQDPR